MKPMTLFFGLLIGLFAYSLYSVFVFFDGTTAVKSWRELCRIEDCETLPELHMTYEVDGRRYYFPSGNHYSFLPLGVISRPGLLRPTFRRPNSTRQVYVNWRVLDFDLYLQTQQDNTLRRGFARVNEDTEIMRFGALSLSRLPAYYGIDTTHPSGALQEFEFYISSKNSNLSEFSLSSQIHILRQQHLQIGTPASEISHLLKSFVASADLEEADFESFNDAFWVVSEEYNSNYAINHAAFVSKVPLLHGRHVFTVCRSQCWFYPVVLADDASNDAPLVAVHMAGADTAVFQRGLCDDANGEGRCDPEKVNFENISLRFDVVERLVAALRVPPAKTSD